MTTSSSESFEVLRNATTAVVRILRSTKKNAMTLSMWTELGNLFYSLAQDVDVRGIVLQGDGGSFCAGADISEFGSSRGTQDQAQAYEVQVDRCLDAIASVPQPTVAAISGPCMGGGFALAQACDFRVADRTAYFSVAAARMGLVYGIPKCQRLVSIVGHTHAKAILLTGKRFDAETVHMMGFVSDVVDGNVLDTALSCLRDAADCAPLATGGMKNVLNALAMGTLEQHRESLEASIARASESADHREAVEAFSNRRKPIFAGR